MKDSIMIDGVAYSIMDLSFESIEGDLIAFNNEKDCVIVFNTSASIIWQHFMNVIKENRNTTSQIICEEIIKHYGKTNGNNMSEVYSDVQSFIQELIGHGILTRQTESI